MTNPCQLCRATDTETFTYRTVIVHGSTVMCVDRIPCVDREAAQHARDEVRWAREDEAQWAREDAEQAAEDAWEDAVNEAMPLLY